MINKLRNIQNLIRWNEWYNSKLSFFFLVTYYLAYVNNKIQLQDMFLLIFIGILLISLSSFGYMLNDYSDKFEDKLTGKKNAMNLLNNQQQFFAITLTAILFIFAFIPFYTNKYAIVFVFLSFLFSILYSAKPFKFKKRGVWGIICVALAQWVFPMLILFSLFEHFKMDLILFILLSLFIGLRWILVHQIIDRDRDILANVNTFVVARSPNVTYDILRVLFVIEIITLTGLVLVLIHSMFFMIIPLLVFYLIFELYLYPLWKKLSFKRMLVSYDYAPLSDLYFCWAPLWFSILLGYLNPLFFIISVIEIVWKKNYLEFDVYLLKKRWHL